MYCLHSLQLHIGTQTNNTRNNIEILTLVLNKYMNINLYFFFIWTIYRYCLSLPQDRFSNLYPEWYIAQSNNQLKKYKLILPINSVIKTPIDVIVYFYL